MRLGRSAQRFFPHSGFSKFGVFRIGHWLAGHVGEEELPEALQEYVNFLEQELAVPISLISTGPDRTETIHRFKQPA